MSNVERLIREEVQTKKRIGRNIKHRKGIKGLGTGYFNPLKGMTQKDIEKLHGETRTYIMTEILPKKELLKLDKDMQKLYMEQWRSMYSLAEIRRGMKITGKTYYELCRELGLGNKPRVSKKAPTEEQNKEIEPVIEIVEGEIVEETDSSSTSDQVEPTELEEVVVAPVMESVAEHVAVSDSPTPLRETSDIKEVSTPQTKMSIAFSGAGDKLELLRKIQGAIILLEDTDTITYSVDLKIK